MLDLYDTLEQYGQSDMYPFHMPGHKRSGAVSFGDPYAIDITEIDGFDNLHHSEGILRDMQEDAAKIYGARQTYFQVNGSSGGLLAAVYAATEQGGEILVARNCHKAVYNAITLRGLTPHYLYPDRDPETGIAGAIRPEQVKEALGAHPAVKTVILVSPNYEGVVAEVEAIAGIVHEAGVVLIVDEAHGAHLPFCKRHGALNGTEDFFPNSAIGCGADLVIQSLHKTMPALTQTALVHRVSERVPLERLEEAMRIFQTSSPSYVLMASIGEAIEWGESMGVAFMAYIGFLRMLWASRATWRCLRLFEPAALGWRGDPGKIVVYDGSGRMTGREIYEWLRLEFHLQPEMCTERYALLMTAPADTGEGFMRLFSALKSLDEELAVQASAEKDGGVGSRRQAAVPILELLQDMTPAQAQAASKESVALAAAPGHIAGEYLYLYPPEIPLLVPGERVTGAFLEALDEYEKAGLSVQGMREHGQLLVTKETS